MNPILTGIGDAAFAIGIYMLLSRKPIQPWPIWICLAQIAFGVCVICLSIAQR